MTISYIQYDSNIMMGKMWIWQITPHSRWQLGSRMIDSSTHQIDKLVNSAVTTTLWLIRFILPIYVMDKIPLDMQEH